MPKKIYQSTVFMSLVTTVEVDGIGHVCEFKGGKYFPEKITGTYATSNVKIQKELEEHERFGGDFILIKTIDEVLKPVVKAAEVKPVAEPVTEPVEVTPTIDPEKPEATEVTPTGEVIVAEVKNGQDAKLYLNHNFEIPFSRLTNNQKIMEEAKIANLIFPNWKQ